MLARCWCLQYAWLALASGVALQQCRGLPAAQLPAVQACYCGYLDVVF